MPNLVILSGTIEYEKYTQSERGLLARIDINCGEHYNPRITLVSLYAFDKNAKYIKANKGKAFMIEARYYCPRSYPSGSILIVEKVSTIRDGKYEWKEREYDEAIEDFAEKLYIYEGQKDE